MSKAINEGLLSEKEATRGLPHPNITNLYKYRAINDYALKGLRNEKVWVSQPNSFDDPFDCNTDNYDPETIGPGTIDILTKSGIDFDFNHPSNIRKFNSIRRDQFKKLAMGFGVLCLADNCESILMWSHYADGHRGFCMEFERTGDSALDDLEIPQPVSYSGLCPSIDYEKTWEPGVAFRLEICKFVFAKAKDWKYEKEWRGIYRHGNREVDYPGKLKSIIWGINTSNEHKRAIKDLLKDSTVVFRQAKRVHREFAIAIEAEEP